MKNIIRKTTNTHHYIEAVQDDRFLFVCRLFFADLKTKSKKLNN